MRGPNSQPVFEWQFAGETKSAPCFAIPEGKRWGDGLLRVVVSPSGRYALVFRVDYEFVREYDLSTGAVVALDSDRGSGAVRAAAYLDDDSWIYSSWRTFAYRRGQGRVLTLNLRCNSLAAARRDAHACDVVAATLADYTSQELVCWSFSGLQPGGALSCTQHAARYAGPRLCRVFERENAAYLEHQGRMYGIDWAAWTA